MSKSTTTVPSRKATTKPDKPYPEFPLSPHASGKWQKKILGRIHYFGRWANLVGGRLERIDGDGWKEALEEYKVQADDLHAGRTPRQAAEGQSIGDLCNRFLTAKLRKVEADEMGQRMFVEYKETTDLIVSNFGKHRPVDGLAGEDFAALRAKLAKRWGPVRLGNAITRIRSVFKYGADNGIIEKTVRFGTEFKKPDKAVMRRHRAQAGPRMLESDQLRRLLDALDGKKVRTGRITDKGKPETVKMEPRDTMRAMVLLGLNCGFGNNDVATLPLSAVDLETGWVNYPRPKTGINRRCPLWPETVAALSLVLKARPATDSDLVFINSSGSPWMKVTENSRTDNISIRFADALKATGLHREGISFYTLRHVHRTIADGARDPVAIDIIMGHADHSMGERYRERIEDERLKNVVNVVRTWLWPDAPSVN